MQPAFHRERIAAYRQDGWSITRSDMFGSWTDGQVRDIQDDMMQLTLEIVAKTLFDAELGDRFGGSQHGDGNADDSFIARTGGPVIVPRWVPDPVNSARRTGRPPAGTDHPGDHRGAASKTARTDGDLLSMLLQAQDDESGRRMTDQQLRDDAMTLFMAGHETTANTLAWAWYLLARHPQVEERCYRSSTRCWGTSAHGGRSAPADLYAEHRLRDVRIYPTAGCSAVRRSSRWSWAGIGSHRDDRFHDPVRHPARSHGSTIPRHFVPNAGPTG